MRQIVVGLVCVCLWNGLAAGARAGVTLARDGEALGVIVHNGHTALPAEIPDKPLGVPKGAIPSAAEELRAYLQKITGAELPMVAGLADAGERPAVVLELVGKVPGAGDADTGVQAYRIRSDGNRIVLTAATGLGLYNAVYGFLEDHLGCHFYSYRLRRAGHGASFYEGPGYEVVPRRPTLEVADIDDFQEPALACRGLIFRMGGYPWILKNRAIGVGGNVSGALAAGHTMYQWIPPEERKVRQGKKQVIIDGLFESHPEFFPMTKDGERHPDLHNQGVCGTAKGLPEYLAQRVLDSVAGQPKDYDDWIKIGQGDGFQGCHCPDCRRLIREQGTEAAPLIHMFNETLDIVGKNYPDLKIITFCYFNTLAAPRTMRVHDNLWIDVVSSSISKNPAGDQMGLIENNPANADYARALREWPQRAPGRVTVWHWDTYRAEWPSMFYIDDNVRYMVDCGVYGINPQTCGGPWDQMINWLYMKLNWDPTLDGDKLIMQYVEDVYSKAAAPYVYQYLETGRDAYESSLHVPSAVRWAGWTQITMDKIFPETVREKMVKLMDQAVLACGNNGSAAQLANLLEARRDSIDKVVMEAAARIGAWGTVDYDGDTWYVAGADPRIAAIVERVKAAMDSPVDIARYVRDKGGPVVELKANGITATICPDLDGRVVRAELLDKQLLDARGAEGGYADAFEGKTWHRIWNTESASRDGLTTRTVLSGRKFAGDTTLLRTVSVGADGLRIQRRFSGDPELGQRFTTRWRLAMPEPRKSRVSVSGGGLKELMDLRYAEPGGIKTVQAGQRPPGYEGLDAMSEKWDAVQAVSDAQVVEFEVKDAKGDLEVLLDRGDGVAAIVTTPAGGWTKVQIKPVVGEHYLDLTLVGESVDEETVTDLALPVQTLTSKTMPLGEAIEENSDPKPQIKATGEATAINEIDVAELVWVPAGSFKRGSDSNVAGADEKPVREIYLDGYWVYKFPVTVGQYKTFCQATGKEFTPPWPQNMKASPVGDESHYAVIVNWFQAAEYARWARGALPTEAQWEKAARGTDGREFPWGNDWQPEKCVSMENTTYDFNEGFRPVGSHPEGAGPYGALDMAGNVWEWTRDWYRYDYYAESPAENPTGPETGANKVVRGGCAFYDWRFSRAGARFVQPPQVDNWTAVGFRVIIEASDVESVADTHHPETAH